MFRSIFSKQFVLHFSALIFSFCMVALALSMAFNQYFINQRAALLEEQGRRISTILVRNSTRSINLFQALRMINNEINVLHEYLNASCIITDSEFRIIRATTDVSAFEDTLLPAGDELTAVLEGRVVTVQGKLGGLFSEQVLTVGYPVIINERVIGSVLMSSSMPELQRNISDMIQITVACLLLSAAVAFALIFIFSRTISKPLTEMNEAAKIIAQGNFERRIGVNSRDEVGQLAESFNYMAESLFLQDKLRQDFISNISHDLRTPLTSMRGFLLAILDGTVPLEKQDYYLRIVLDETERLSKLTHDIIDINKIHDREVGLDKSVFDINSLIRKVVLMLESRVLQKRINLDLSFAHEENQVYADYEKIQRVIYNLLDNALKFTGENGAIGVETSVEGRQVIISVKDNGPGIPEEEQKRVFERFYKADASRGEDRKGSGLGLAIVQSFVKAHGKSVRLNSREGIGSVFTFALPRGDKDAAG